MAEHGSSQRNTMEAPTETRQRLRPWLIHQLDSGNVLGLDWIDRKNMVFKIPWKHGGKQDWDPRQAQIFKDWAVHTGKFREDTDKPNYAKWKTNLRCALNKAPDIKEIPERTRKDEPNPYKVYQFLEKKKRGSIPINLPSNDYPPADHTTTDGAVVPTFVHEYSSSGSCPSGQRQEVEPMFASQSRSVVPAAERLPSDLGSVRSNDLITLPNGGLSAQEPMDFDEDNMLGTLDGPLTDTSPTSQSSYDYTSDDSPYDQGLLFASDLTSQAEEAKYTPPLFTIPGIPPQQTKTLVYSQTTCTNAVFTQAANNVMVKPEAIPAHIVPFDNSRPSHDCHVSDGCDMFLEILYRNHLLTTHHISSRKGCRITHNASHIPQEALPDIFRDALYGVDSQQRQSVELPEWPNGLCPETLLPSIQDLLKNMQRGLILECKHGDIMATRLCKTTVYYSTSKSPTEKLARHDESIQVTKIFDIENNFKPALDRFDKFGGERPSPYVYLYIGQKGSELDLGSLLIVVRLTSCKALQLLNEVDSERCHEHSMHISESNEYDRIANAVTDQLQNPPV